MDPHPHPQPQPGSQPPCSSSTKVERRLVEKNRRNQMKILYSKLNSLLPSYNPMVHFNFNLITLQIMLIDYITLK